VHNDGSVPARPDRDSLTMRTVQDPRLQEPWHAPAPLARPTSESPLADYLAAFRRFRWLLIAGPLGAALVAYVVSLLLTPEFEARATLMVSQSKTGEAVAPVSDVRNFRAFLDNRSLAAEVVKEFRLDGPGYGLTPQRFLDRHVDVQEVRATNLLSIGVTLKDPQLAARVANTMAERAVALSRSLEQAEAVVARDIIKGQLDAARDRLTSTRQALEAYQKRAQVDLLQKKADVLIDQQAELQDLLVDIRGERAYLEQAERGLAAQDPVRNVRRSVQVPPPPPRPTAERPRESERPQLGATEDTAEPRRETERPGDRTPPAGARLGVRDELVDPFINPSFEVLQQDVNAARSRLAQLEHKRDEMQRGRSADGQLPALAAYYERKAAEDELKMQQELAEKIYVDVATRYEQARLQIASRSAQLQVVDAALVPDRKVYPREKLIASAAAVLMVSLLAAVIVATTALRRTLHPAAPAAEETTGA
jgi:polysaccharide biosynthesis transport protein